MGGGGRGDSGVELPLLKKGEGGIEGGDDGGRECV